MSPKTLLVCNADLFDQPLHVCVQLFQLILHGYGKEDQFLSA
jgi:hypothetical protein